jgi:hypothetical protein
LALAVTKGPVAQSASTETATAEIPRLFIFEFLNAYTDA